MLARHEHAPWYESARATWDSWTERALAATDAAEIQAMMAEVLPLYTAHPERPGCAGSSSHGDARPRAISPRQGLGGRPVSDHRPAAAARRRALPHAAPRRRARLICGPAHSGTIAEAIPHAEVVIVPVRGTSSPARRTLSGKPSSPSATPSAPCRILDSPRWRRTDAALGGSPPCAASPSGDVGLMKTRRKRLAPLTAAAAALPVRRAPAAASATDYCVKPKATCGVNNLDTLEWRWTRPPSSRTRTESSSAHMSTRRRTRAATATSTRAHRWRSSARAPASTWVGLAAAASC